MKMIEIAKSDDVKEGSLFAGSTANMKLLLTRVDGKVCAFLNKCPHMGLSMEKGKIDNGVITCPWHNSAFDVCTGENRDWCSGFLGKPMPGWTRKLIAMGRKPAPLSLVEVKEEGDAVLVKPEV